LGQDPYHRPGQAEGLAFSVASGQPQPPSLRNIFKELRRSLGVPPAKDGSLLRWARQGVLLLNTCLTVEEGRAGSHAQWGWETLTDSLVGCVAAQPRPVVFMLWGAHAQRNREPSLAGGTRRLRRNSLKMLRKLGGWGCPDATEKASPSACPGRW
ncbi:MAG: uracil-DNA glycosylase, partial [Limnohabitans sp.]